MLLHVANCLLPTADTSGNVHKQRHVHACTSLEQHISEICCLIPLLIPLLICFVTSTDSVTAESA